ncbi:hypothetical protein [Polymorphum gilvum]|uniref:Uncharacterized protein n=1 Tax=Polymorphum gilvum (strain LMG 25793 / CGMCC 1.9160 / SL003B-26A1) TaxID=991905 RepID=F2IVX6_POLGS|nr:hypothetical protein [Polymorphum gilvum]ADZ70258.1 hypothetical protein SL003B_1832 [Polymorphum gilvum SL003B-26A1]
MSRLPLSAVASVVLVLSTAAFGARAYALEQDDLDSLSRHLAASGEAAARFGEVGETLTNLGKNSFAGAGTGSQKRDLARRANAALDPWRRASAATKASLPYKVAPHAFMVSDVITSVMAPGIEGDYRGATSNAVNIAVSVQAVGGGVALFGAIGSGVGATLGSFIPVVGTAFGGMVGGAIGKVAGGYIAATGYDLYVKEAVGQGVDAGLSCLFDTDPLSQARQARQEFLRAKAAADLLPRWEALHAVGRDFGGGETELVGPGGLPRVLPPDVEPNVAQTTGNVLAGVRKFSLGPQVWEITDGAATFETVYPGVVHTTHTARGTVGVNRIEGTMIWVHRDNDRRCGYVVRETHPFLFLFTADTVSGTISPGSLEILETRGSCEQSWENRMQQTTFTAPWGKVE